MISLYSYKYNYFFMKAKDVLRNSLKEECMKFNKYFY